MKMNENISVVGKSNIDGEVYVGEMSVIFLNGKFSINIRGKEGVNLYAFNLFLINSLANGEYTYVFSGPKLGLYHDTADPREGPYVNHYIESATVHVKVETDIIRLNITCTANLEKSSIDPYCYKGRKKGIWVMNVECDLPDDRKKS